VLPEEFDELSPKEELYYQKPPFSTNEVFLGSKGGVSQLVDRGPEGVRQGYAEPLESTGIQLNQSQKNYLKTNLSSKEWNKLDFNRPLKADAINYGVVQRNPDGGKNPLYRRVKLLLEHQALPPGKRPVPSSIYTVGERNKINTIIKTQLKKKEIPTRANIATIADVSEDYVEKYVIDTKGQKFHDKHFSYEAGKMKVGTIQDRKDIFNYLKNREKTSIADISKHFKWNKSKTTGLIGELLGDMYRKRGAGTAMHLPEDIDLLKKVTTTIRNSPDFEDIYQRRMHTLLQEAYAGKPRETYLAAQKKLNNYFKVTRELRNKVPKLGMTLDHIIPFGFLEMVEAGQNPMHLIRVRPIPSEVNTFKRHFDNARIAIIKGLKKNPNDKKLLEQFKYLKQFEDMAPIEFGGVTRTGNITEWGVKAFGKSKLLADLENAPQLYKNVYKFAQEVLDDPEKLALAKKAGVAQTEKMFRDIPKLTEIQEAKYKKNLKSLIEKIGCPGLAGGGRVGFKDGSRCFNKGLDNIKNKNFKTKAQADNMLKLAKTGARSASLKAWLGIWGLGGEVIIEGGIGAYKVLGKGVPVKIAWSESYISYPFKKLGLSEEGDLRRKEMMENRPNVATYFDALEKLEEKEKLERNLQFEEKRTLGQQIIAPEGWNKKRIAKAQNELDKYNEVIRNFYGDEQGIYKTLEKHQAEVDEAEATENAIWARKAITGSISEREADRRQRVKMEELMATKGRKNIAGRYREPIWKKDPKAEPWIDFTPAFRTATDIARASLSDTDLEEIMKSYGVSDLIGNYEKYDDYKKAYIRVKREKDPKLSAGIIKSGFKYDPAMLGTQERFAHGGLTRTVAPDSGPVSRGLRSLYIDDMD